MKNKKQARYVLAVKDSRAAEPLEKVCFQTEIFVLFFLPSSSPCLKDQFAVSHFSKSLIVQLGDAAPLIGLFVAVDLLIFSM